MLCVEMILIQFFSLAHTRPVQTKFPNGDIPAPPKMKLKSYEKRMVDVANRLADKLDLPKPSKESVEWLILTAKSKLPQPERLVFPLPEKDGEGNFVLPKKANIDLNSTNNPNPRKRPHEQSDSQQPHTLNRYTMNRRALVAPVMNKQPTAEQLALALKTNGNESATTNGNTRISIARLGNKSKLISWTDAPDDFFVSTEATKKLRQEISLTLIKQLRRSPCIKNVQFPASYDATKL